MEGLLSFWASKQSYNISIVILFVAMGLFRYGTRILANWLGITDTNARRLYTGFVIAMWLLFYVARLAMRSSL